MIKKVKKALWVLTRLIIVVGIFLLILRKISFPSHGVFLAPRMLCAMAVAVAVGVLQTFLCAVRWRIIARVWIAPPGLALSFWAYIEGLFCNQAMPSFVGGDALRIMRWKGASVQLRHATASVFLDRMFGALGAALLAMLACIQLYRFQVEQYKLLIAFALGISVLLGAAAVFLLARIHNKIQLGGKFARLHSFADTVRLWAPNGFDLSIIAVLAILGQVLSGLCVYVISIVLEIDLSFFTLISVTGIILLVSMIPISLAGWGIREAGFIALLVPMSVNSTSALALGVAFGFSQLLSSLPGGLSILMGLARHRPVMTQ